MKNILLFAVIALFIMGIIGCAKTQVIKPVPQQVDTGTQEESEQAQEPSEEMNTEVECNSDAECGEEVIGEPYCFQGSIMTPKRIPKCSFPGTINSYCRQESKDVTTPCSKGSEFCMDGKCLVIAEQPCTDTDGGKTYNISGRVTDGLLEVFVDNCLDDSRTLIETYCSDGEKGRGLTEEYRCPDRCSSGACVEDD